MNRTRKRAGAAAGITLVELLIVITLIGLLLCVMLPAVSSAIDLARAVDCKSNLRQLAFAVRLYTKDSGGLYPPAWVIQGSGSRGWCGGYHSGADGPTMDVTESPLWPYLGDKRVLRCASYTPAALKYAASGEISGYGINSQYVAGDPVSDPNDGAAGMSSYARPAAVTEIRHPDQTVLLADCGRVKKGVVTEEFFIWPLTKPGSKTRNAATIHFRHSGQANAAFCDGHVEEMEPLELDPAGDGRCGWLANEIMDRN